MLPYRFVHLGDLHLGPNERNVDRMRVVDEIIAAERHQPISAWLLPGDLNDGAMRIADKNFLTSRVTQMADLAPVVICYGNHDLPGDLDFLAKLQAAFPIYVINRPQVIRVPLAGGGVAAIFVLPYPTRMGLVGAGVPSEQIVDAAKAALDVIFINAAAQLAEATERGDVPLMIGHVNVGGSITSAGQPNIGREIELDHALLQRFQGIYVGLNHIHRAQHVACAWYAGSCCRLDWGEIEEKRYLAVKYSDQTTYSVESHLIDVAPMYKIDGALTREGFTWHLADCAFVSGREAVCFCLSHKFTGAEVRVDCRFAAAESTALNFDLVKAPFAGAKRIDVIPIAEHTRALRAPEVNAAETLEDKVTAFTTAAGVRWTPALDLKLAGLLNPDSAAFLTQIESDLQPTPEREEVCQ